MKYLLSILFCILININSSHLFGQSVYKNTCKIVLQDSCSNNFTPLNISSYKMKIFDIWGNELYNGKSSWNCIYNNKQCVNDIYLYVITYKCIDTEETIVGSFILNR